MAAREAAVYTAKLAEQAHRYDDMAEAMKSVALMNVELTAEESNLLTLAYENMIMSRRASVIKLESIEHHEDEQRNAEYIRKVEEEASKICDEFTSILYDHVIPSTMIAKDRVYFYKMIGDNYAHRVGDDRIKAATNSIFAYQVAMTIAKLELSGSSPIRLGLALNVAVMECTMFDAPGRAFEIGDEALRHAYENLSDEEFEESLEIIILLINHLKLWHIYILEDEVAIAREELRNGPGFQMGEE